MQRQLASLPESKRITKPFQFHSPGADNAYSPDGNWYVASHKIEEKRGYTFYRFADKSYINSPTIQSFSGSEKYGVTRVNGAPRRNQTIKANLDGSVADDGSGQLFVVKILSLTQ